LFFAGGLDDPNQVESARETAVYAHGVFQTVRRSREATSVKIGLILPVGRINGGIAEPVK
jgi:hypothetical protein